jgi:tetratricopeptide (TPR) repeat protein
MKEGPQSLIWFIIKRCFLSIPQKFLSETLCNVIKFLDMKIAIRFIIANCLLIICAISCKSENKSAVNPFTASVSADSIRVFKCKKDSSQTYTVLLPANYKSETRWPVIFAFDPHGDGHLPLQKMREPASQLGYILIGSENFRNGVTNIQGIAAAMFEDAMSRFSIDDKRVYLAGFSGGARAAGSIALSGKGIRGIILSGAGQSGFRADMKSSGLVVYGIAGLGDFNMSEIQNMDKELTSFGIVHSISFFNGKHEWPAVEELKQALLWLNFQAMHENLCPINKGELNWFAKYSDSMATGYINSGKVVMAANLYQKAISALKDLYPVKDLEKKLNSLISTSGYQAAARNEEMLSKLEERLKSEYSNAMLSQNENLLSKDEKWWANELKVLNDRCNSEKDPLKLGMYNRLKGFLGILSYSYTSRMVQAGNVKEGERLIAIYSLIEPENPDWMYYKALLFDKQGNSQKAIEELKLSISKGLGDRARIARDFSSIVQKAIK